MAAMVGALRGLLARLLRRVVLRVVRRSAVLRVVRRSVRSRRVVRIRNLIVAVAVGLRKLAVVVAGVSGRRRVVRQGL